MTYTEAESILLALPRFADAGAAAFKPGLERMRVLLGTLGNPHERFRSVHVAGTNGKGSTCSLLAAIGTASGLRVGLHTSPHLHDLAERLRVDGVPAPHAWIADAVDRMQPALDRVQPSFFEATVALSFLYFAEQEVDLAVVEVGLGGRLDATNVLMPVLALVTAVDLDHADLLGDTRAAIAHEKAGIAKLGVPLLTSATGEDVIGALRETAEERGALFAHVADEVEIERAEEQADGLVLDLRTPVRRYEALRVGMPGAHQAGNAALAVRAAERMFGASEEAVREGVGNVLKLSGLSGRCQILHASPAVLADVAHNGGGLRAALRWARGTVRGRLTVLFGAMRDKDLAPMADALADAGVHVVTVPVDSARSVPYLSLREALSARGIPATAADDVHTALHHFRLDARPDDGLLAAGSHLLVADVQRALRA